MYLITDSEEQSLGLPSGKHDIGLMLESKMYNSDGSLNFDTHDNRGLWGDVIHVYVATILYISLTKKVL